jgi:catechol 2,3-dioxygenase-like lactoylglutathione lyase family enzyme
MSLDRLITHLRHVDLAVPDFAAQRAFYTDLWGLTEVASDSGLSYLAAEGSSESHVVRIRQSDAKGVETISLGAADRSSVDQLAEQLGTAGVTIVSEPGDLSGPFGGYGVRFFDPDGRVIEVSTDVQARTARDIEVGESIPVKLSHCVVNSTDSVATAEWYENHLGFDESDRLVMPDMGVLMIFLRCNDTHHSLAIAGGPHASLHHLSFELRGIDEYLRGTGRLLRAGGDLIWGPGRHTAGDNTFSYFLDPSGNTMEYTTEMARVDESSWVPQAYDVTQPMTQDQWGTAAPMGPDIASKSFNDPDACLFVAPAC